MPDEFLDRINELFASLGALRKQLETSGHPAMAEGVSQAIAHVGVVIVKDWGFDIEDLELPNV